MDDRHGQAQVMHSLANLIGRGNPKEAENFYRQSLQILQQMDDRHGEAQVLRSLGLFLADRSPPKLRRNRTE